MKRSKANLEDIYHGGSLRAWISILSCRSWYFLVFTCQKKKSSAATWSKKGLKISHDIMNNLKSRALHTHISVLWTRSNYDRLLYQEESCATTIDLFADFILWRCYGFRVWNLWNLRKKKWLFATVLIWIWTLCYNKYEIWLCYSLKMIHPSSHIREESFLKSPLIFFYPRFV